MVSLEHPRKVLACKNNAGGLWEAGGRMCYMMAKPVGPNRLMLADVHTCTEAVAARSGSGALQWLLRSLLQPCLQTHLVKATSLHHQRTTIPR